MTVYILFRNFKAVVGVFSAEENANKACGEYKAADPEGFYLVCSMVVDEYQKPDASVPDWNEVDKMFESGEL